MRACFLGQNVCALGFGVATLQTPPLMAEPEVAQPETSPAVIPDATLIGPGGDISTGFAGTVHTAIPARGPVPPVPLA